MWLLRLHLAGSQRSRAVFSLCWGSSSFMGGSLGAARSLFELICGPYLRTLNPRITLHSNQQEQAFSGSGFPILFGQKQVGRFSWREKGRTSTPSPPRDRGWCCSLPVPSCSSVAARRARSLWRVLDHHSSRCRLRHLVASECAQRHIGDHVLEGRVLEAVVSPSAIDRSLSRA